MFAKVSLLGQSIFVVFLLLAAQERHERFILETFVLKQL